MNVIICTKNKNRLADAVWNNDLSAVLIPASGVPANKRVLEHMNSAVEHARSAGSDLFFCMDPVFRNSGSFPIPKGEYVLLIDVWNADNNEDEKEGHATDKLDPWARVDCMKNILSFMGIKTEETYTFTYDDRTWDGSRFDPVYARKEIEENRSRKSEEYIRGYKTLILSEGIPYENPFRNASKIGSMEIDVCDIYGLAKLRRVLFDYELWKPRILSCCIILSGNIEKTPQMDQFFSKDHTIYRLLSELRFEYAKNEEEYLRERLPYGLNGNLMMFDKEVSLELARRFHVTCKRI